MNWGDLNGDGRSDYVDQKIFDTQINPYSGEYQGNMPSSGSGNDGGVFFAIVFLFFALVLIVAFPGIGIWVGIMALVIFISTKTGKAKDAESKRQQRVESQASKYSKIAALSNANTGEKTESVEKPTAQQSPEPEKKTITPPSKAKVYQPSEDTDCFTSRNQAEEVIKQGILSNMKPGKRYTVGDMLRSFNCFDAHTTPQKVNALMSQLKGRGNVVRTVEDGTAYFSLPPKPPKGAESFATLNRVDEAIKQKKAVGINAFGYQQPLESLDLCKFYDRERKLCTLSSSNYYYSDCYYTGGTSPESANNRHCQFKSLDNKATDKHKISAPQKATVIPAAAEKHKTFVITDECLSCGSCAGQCLVEAIGMGDMHYEIDQSKCVGCGFCADQCPAEAIVKNN